MPAGDFELTTQSGAEITFTLPTPPTDPAVAELEAFRDKAGGAPVTYLVAKVDNREGSEPVNMYMVAVFDEEGRQYTFSPVIDALNSWKPSLDSDYKYKLPDGTVLDDAAGDELSRSAADLNNENLGEVDPDERATVVLASTDVDLPREFTRVSVQPSGMGDGEEAKPAAD